MNRVVFVCVVAVVLVSAVLALKMERIQPAKPAVSPLTETQHQNLFLQWMQQHSKSYHAHEFVFRFQNFKRNIEFVRNYNHVHRQADDARLALNQFADMSREEFKSKFLTLRMPTESVHTAPKIHQSSNVQLPTSVDWRTKNAVTGVKDQGQCGSCWSFSTTGSVEGAWAIKTGNLVSLSEQNLVDCSSSFGNEGCNGGLMTLAFEYIISNGGIDTEASYPYTATDGNDCQYTVANRGATISSYVNITTGSESDLANAVATVGPVSVAIDANHDEFMFYTSGVLYIPDCSSTELDHGVLAVGYGQTSSGTQYWIVKNSWNTSWGMSGYVWMAKNRSNNCGIATMASYPIV